MSVGWRYLSEHGAARTTGAGTGESLLPHPTKEPTAHPVLEATGSSPSELQVSTCVSGLLSGRITSPSSDFRTNPQAMEEDRIAKEDV